jgi:hypothetical protein
MTLPTKPPHRAPCNGCGVCCITALCREAKRRMPDASAPCVLMHVSGGRAWCSIADESGMRTEMLIGTGCTMRDDLGSTPA